MSDQPNFVTCPCQYCSGGIELTPAIFKMTRRAPWNVRFVNWNDNFRAAFTTPATSPTFAKKTYR